jgi:hypothetical protein
MNADIVLSQTCFWRGPLCKEALVAHSPDSLRQRNL